MAILIQKDGRVEEGNYTNDVKNGVWTLTKEGKSGQNVF